MTNQRDAEPQRGASYQAYLIRLWQDGPHAAWHASAQAVPSGEIVRFATLEALFTFLRGQTIVQTEPPQ